MATKLSVNINKWATLRNARGGNNPDLLKTAQSLEAYGGCDAAGRDDGGGSGRRAPRVGRRRGRGGAGGGVPGACLTSESTSRCLALCWEFMALIIIIVVRNN